MKRDVPEIYVLSPNRETYLSTVKDVSEFTEDIRFNACSEVSFTTPSKIYDIENEVWIDNPSYESLSKNNLLFIQDNTDYFKVPVRTYGDSSFYSLGTQTARNVNAMQFTPTFTNSNCVISSETELFDIGSDSGYMYQGWTEIKSRGNEPILNGSLISYQDRIGEFNTHQDLQYASNICKAYKYIACDSFIPVHGYDVLSFSSYEGSTEYYKFSIHFYNDNTEDSAIGSLFVDTETSPYNSRVNRWTMAEWINEIVGGSNYTASWEGYLRVGAYSVNSNYNYDTSYDGSNTTTDSWDYTFYYPTQGHVKIYSGERLCTSVKNKSTNGYRNIKMHWFVITDIKEVDYGLYKTKEVSAKSYEYVLQNHLFAVSEETLPLFIPECINDTVNSDSWIIDKYTTLSSLTTTRTGEQKLTLGILNQILKYAPAWSLENISSSAMTKYRQVSEVDDADIYSFLMNTIQPTYNCFILFDNDDLTMHIYSQLDLFSVNDTFNPNTYIHLTWDNSIKELEKQHISEGGITALNVHSADDTYGIGVINPTGNNMVYRFNEVIDQMDYNVEPGRTLADAVSLWVSEWEDNSTYKGYGQTLIGSNIKLIKAESQYAECLAQYRSIVDEIRIKINANKSSSGPWYVFQNKAGVSLDPYIDQIMLSYKPTSADNIRKLFNEENTGIGYNSTYGRGYFAVDHKLFEKLREAALDLNAVKQTVTNARSNYNTSVNRMREIAKTLTLNYNTALEANNNDASAYQGNGGTTILSANEIKELQNYLVEGSWTNENVTFSDAYSASDIITTIGSLYQDVNEDLINRLSTENYEFTVSLANIRALKGFDLVMDRFRLGETFYLHYSDSEFVAQPMLLETHINYKDETDFSYTFTTDYKSKPLQYRFADLYATIPQTSVESHAFTFDE